MSSRFRRGLHEETSATTELEHAVRDLIVTENITLDGVIDAAEGWFGPAGDPEADESDLEAALASQMAAADAFLVGRVTFEEMRGYWPEQTDDTTGVSAYLDSVAKYVFSGTLDEPGWENTTVLRGDVLDVVRDLKASPGDMDIVATGSMQLIATLVTSGLVDEYRLFVHPFVAGEGQRLFADADLGPVDVVETTAFRSGVVLQRYRPSPGAR